MPTAATLFQVVFYLFALLILVKPLGWYMAQVYEGKPFGLDRIARPVEKLIYRLCGIQPDIGMTWKSYLSAMLVFNLLGMLFVYIFLRLQGHLPFNPANFPAIPSYLAFNTAASFVTNADWQAYSGETTISYFTQMLAFTTQNFLSAATGMSLLIALTRGIARQEAKDLGNFWVDAVRGILYILLPLSFMLSLFLISQGVIQSLSPNITVNVLQPTEQTTQQIIPMGPVATQVAIAQLGTNGGGFFNSNAAHPFANPTPLSNFFELLAILLIPAALCYTFGIMVNDKRQGWAILIAMSLIFVPCLSATIYAEQQGNPAFIQMGINQIAETAHYPSGNMEGKETRFGIVNSALWTTATTAASNGSVNSMLDSYTPIGGLIPLWLIQLGEVIFGGVGSGLYGMLMLVIITVFIAGLMVGRTPEYLGKKIEPYEMKMASIAVLIMPLIVLLSTAVASILPIGTSAVSQPGPHGFTEILYAFTSMSNSNGSAFSGLNADTPFYNLLGALVMLIGRYWIAIPVLAIAGSLVQKKKIPSSSGTLTTHTPLFVILLVSVTLILGALSFLPTLSLGPIVEQLILWGQYGH